MKARYEPAARVELLEALRWYLDNAGPRRADAFERELDVAVHLVMSRPGLGTPGPGGTRSLPLPRFPYTLHYRAEHETIRILAVAHQRRKPGYWRKR